MHRRDALRFLGSAAIAPLIAPLSPLERWNTGTALHRRLAEGLRQGKVLSSSQLAEVRALAETIIPRTDTPGAADVGAPEFIDLLLAEWYPETERAQLLRALDALTERCRAEHGKPIAEVDPGARQIFVGKLDGAQAGVGAGSAEWGYGRIKESLVFAFLTSPEIGPLVSTMPITPGRFDGCVPI
jgi:hypothetical protein